MYTVISDANEHIHRSSSLHDIAQCLFSSKTQHQYMALELHTPTCDPDLNILPLYPGMKLGQELLHTRLSVHMVGFFPVQFHHTQS